ncbi:cilia- and flagella-associated protein 45 [Zeugodacus cucurbitae]|uniref:Cingulin-like protein 1 n=1 Tax=Zeugodacus cucurbitae TaxID=28588 RepID=A0A0A1WN30_ZEUCU|nr:cilia- and flagella-associated protein 45 [Zeugodacus cucurbitae]
MARMLTAHDIFMLKFMNNSERKSVYRQIKDLVKKAHNVSKKELEQRRKRLHLQLEHDAHVYQEEFAIKVKSRIDEDIQKRKDVLLKIKEQRDQQDKEFLEQMKIRRHLSDCFEIRDALNHKEMLQVKETQLEQITEKQRAFVRANEIDKYWQKVCMTREQHQEKLLEGEKNLIKCMQRRTCDILDAQVAEHKRQREEELEQKRIEGERVRKNMEEIRLEKFDRPRTSTQTLAYREDLLNMIAEKTAERKAEERERMAEHRALMQEIAKEEQQHSSALVQRKRAVYKATMEYIDYARRMHKLEEDAEAARNARIDDLKHVDECVKLKAELKHKADLAALYYTELRRQMCEEYERRLREAQEQREDKIIENRFARSQKSRADIKADQRKMREDLDRLLAENVRIQAEEEAKYNKHLLIISEDRNFCKNLAEQYITERKDYLPIHPNWVIYSCPRKQYVAKCGDVLDQMNTCIRPCACGARTYNDCVQHSFLTQLKRGPNADKMLSLKNDCWAQG